MSYFEAVSVNSVPEMGHMVLETTKLYEWVVSGHAGVWTEAKYYVLCSLHVLLACHMADGMRSTASTSAT